MTWTSGWKTYAVGAGLIGLAIYQFSQSDFEHGIQSFLAGLAALGLRHAISTEAAK